MASKKILSISSVEKLDYIRQRVCNISEEKLRAAINTVRKQRDLDALMNILSNLNNTFAAEEERLLEDSETHNKKYANVDNDKYSTAYTVLNNIKQSVFAFYKIVRMFSKQKSHAFYGNRNETKSLEFRIRHSTVGDLEVTGYIFDNLTPCQKRVFTEMENFIEYLDRSLGICIRIIEEEESIRKDVTKIQQLFEKQIEEVYQIVKRKKGGSKGKTFYKELLEADSNPENVRKWFHKITPEQMGDVAIGLKDQRLSEFTPSQRYVFNENPEAIRFFVDVVSHIDDCTDKITGDTIVNVMKYTNCTSSQTAFYECFRETYMQNGGKHRVVSKQRFNQACTEQNHGKPNNYDSFVSKMDMYVF